MKKSIKVKNPCKICFEAVNKKKGLQCQGACQKWAHYKCLNYSPGKIEDIKAGLVRITCPCPDCVASEAKCPNRPQTCSSSAGPVKPIPFYLSQPCRQMPPCQSRIQIPVHISPKCSNVSLPRTRGSYPQVFTACPPTYCSKQTSPNMTPQASQCNLKYPNRRSQSTSAMIPNMSSSGSGIHLKCVPRRTSSCDSKLSARPNPKELICSLDEMCKTVGELTIQLRSLMCKMIEANSCQG
ncbi:unnamed protein product [Leptosia nina]|uniref:PHD-type domain-containing protein n=1 Tax=Leptosia nina TaxID=320188 RepID=A0AAV1IV06_9NEOP